MKSIYVRFVGDRPDNILIENVWTTTIRDGCFIIQCHDDEKFMIPWAAVAYVKEAKAE